MSFQRVKTQFLAALGDGAASSGTNASKWGIWRVDPGPRGVPLTRFGSALAGGTAPAGWTHDPDDFWIEEFGRIMEKPEFPLPAGRYLVTGDREVTTPLTVEADGSWRLDEGTLHDVTHLPCRSARYTGGAGSPADANPAEFPVTPGAEMPHCGVATKMDYRVIFVVALGV